MRRGTSTIKERLPMALALVGLAVVAVVLGGGLRRDDAAAAPAGLVGATVEIAATPAPPPSPMAMNRLRDGVAAADAGDWATVASLRQSAADPLVSRILHWRTATDPNAPLSFDELRRALEDLQGWPGRTGMRERAEGAIGFSGLSASERVSFLTAEGGPHTGDGMAALAQAYRDLGDRQGAEALAREAWRTARLSASSRALILNGFGAALAQEDHVARVDVLLWRGQRSEAQELFSRIGPADRAVAQARIALQTRPRRGLQAAVDAVPASRQDDPGFLYDRARYVRRAGRPEDAVGYAARIVPAAAPEIARDDIFRERRVYVSTALRTGAARRAYGLAAGHAIPSGAEFADAEWLAGWVALRYLDDPAAALDHFTRLGGNVSSPISLSRAHYWRAQAAEALGQASARQEALATAAQYDYTYYGQLAAVQQNPAAVIDYPADPAVPETVRARFEARELVQALRLMTQVGDREDFDRIAFHLDDVLEDPLELELLAALARENDYARSALRSAKAGLFRGVVAPFAAYPVIPLPAAAQGPGRPEPALVHAIIRQESEFNREAMSPVGARGLMQLMPATARSTAAREGLPYAIDRLTADPDYNITLGASYLGGLIDQFNGSYVLSIAAYNAGPGRSNQWIADWGDPRSGRVDVVDWVELIPFSETRNYVQRVMENLQVYRHRLSGGPAPIRIEQDLARGG